MNISRSQRKKKYPLQQPMLSKKKSSSPSIRVRELPQMMPRSATLPLLLIAPTPPQLKKDPITSLEKTTSRAVVSTGRTAKIAMRAAPSRRRRLRLLSGRRI
jgi:hypothetical protein